MVRSKDGDVNTIFKHRWVNTVEYIPGGIELANTPLSGPPKTTTMYWVNKYTNREGMYTAAGRRPTLRVF
jgi:hypothetical protein